MTPEQIASLIKVETGCEVRHVRGRYELSDPIDGWSCLADLEIMYAADGWSVTPRCVIDGHDLEAEPQQGADISRVVALALLQLEQRSYSLAWSADHRARAIRDIRPKLRDLS
jgi:hypothetical protein